MTKYILKWCIITLAGLICLAVLTIFSLCLISPLSMAKICDDLGLKKLENTFFIADYKKNDNINSLYKVVINSYSLKNYDYVEKYYEELESNDRYHEFIAYVNEQNFKLKVGNLSKSALLNEDNYLKNRYIIALVNNNKIDKAFDYAVENFKNYSDYNYKDQGNYLFYNLVQLNDDSINQRFLNNYTFDDTLYNKLLDYIDLCIKNFDGDDIFMEGDSVYLIALNTRIRQVYLNLVLLSDELDLQLPLDLKDNVDRVNDIAKELL